MSPQDAVIGRAEVGVGGAVSVWVVTLVLVVEVGDRGVGVVFAGVVDVFVVAVVAEVFVAVGVVDVFVVATEEAAWACMARRETPAIAARATEPVRLENLRDIACFLRSE